MQKSIQTGHPEEGVSPTKDLCISRAQSIIIARKTIAIAALVIVACLTAPAQKQQPLPKDLPPYGALKPFTPPAVQASKLPNGLTIWLVPEPGFPKVAFAVAVRGGLAADPADRPGLADLLADVLPQGTKTRSSRQIAEEMQGAGGDLSASARADSMFVQAEVLASHTESGLAVLADVLQNAAFPQDEFEIARSNAADNLRAQEAEPGFLANRALYKAVFGDHPYATISPTQASLAALTPADLRREYARRYRPDQALLVCVGDFDPVRMKAAIESSLGKWAAPAGEGVAAPPAPPATSPHAMFTLARPGSVQTTLVLAALGPSRSSPDYAAVRVANAVFGGMFGSRMTRNIREDKGYSYSPYSYVQTRQSVGLVIAQADVRNVVTGASLNEMTYELNRMATTEPTDDELNTAHRFLVGNRAISLQSRASVASQLAALWVDNLPPDELGRESERFEKVTAKDVAEVGRKYFPAERATVVAVGEQQAIDSQLKLFGLPQRPGFAPDVVASKP
jgi:zinc protease